MAHWLAESDDALWGKIKGPWACCQVGLVRLECISWDCYASGFNQDSGTHHGQIEWSGNFFLLAGYSQSVGHQY